MTAALTIRALADRHGLTLRALRLYEARGLLHPARAPDGVTRLYGAQDEVRCAAIVAAKRLGFTLAEIGERLRRGEYDRGGLVLAPAERAAQLAHLRRRRAELDAAIAALEALEARPERRPS